MFPPYFQVIDVSVRNFDNQSNTKLKRSIDTMIFSHVSPQLFGIISALLKSIVPFIICPKSYDYPYCTDKGNARQGSKVGTLNEWRLRCSRIMTKECPLMNHTHYRLICLINQKTCDSIVYNIKGLDVHLVS